MKKLYLTFSCYLIEFYNHQQLLAIFWYFICCIYIEFMWWKHINKPIAVNVSIVFSYRLLPARVFHFGLVFCGLFKIRE